MSQEPQHSSRRNDYQGLPYPGEDRRYNDQQGWHLDKKVPLAFILALIVQTIMIVIAFQDVKRDTALNTAAITVLKAADTQQRADNNDALMLVREGYKSLNDKLDRLIERSVTK